MNSLEQPTSNRLSPNETLKPFSCSDQDLTSFFHDDPSHYGRELLAVTYTIENSEEVIAYYSVSNDKTTRK